MNCRFHNKSPCPECSMDDLGYMQKRAIKSQSDRELTLSQPDLGVTSSTIIAKRLGLSTHKVQRFMRDAGIESFQKRSYRINQEERLSRDEMKELLRNEQKLDMKFPYRHTPSWISPYLERWGRAT